MLSKLAFTFYMVVHRGLLYSFPQVAQLVKIRLHMQALSLNCNLIFCSAGQHDHDLSLCLPNPPPPPSHPPAHHSWAYYCHQNVVCQQQASAPHLHTVTQVTNP